MRSLLGTNKCLHEVRLACQPSSAANGAGSGVRPSARKLSGDVRLRSKHWTSDCKRRLQGAVRPMDHRRRASRLNHGRRRQRRQPPLAKACWGKPPTTRTMHKRRDGNEWLFAFHQKAIPDFLLLGYTVSQQGPWCGALLLFLMMYIPIYILSWISVSRRLRVSASCDL